MKKLISLLLIVCNVSFGADTVYIKQGDPAPYEGFLFTPERTKQLKLDLDNLTYYKQLNDHSENINTLQKEQIANQDARLKNYEEQITLVNKRAADVQESAWFGKVGMFLLGAGLASLIAIGVSHAVR